MAVSLPIDSVLPQLRQALASRRAVVLQAPPGAGKTTRVPLALLDEPWLGGRKILILEPRRLAARAAAARMAQVLGEIVGRTVGYRIRFDTRVSPMTRLEVVTEGILTRRLQTDLGLEGVGLVIFDEFHERHLHGDLALALTLDCQRVLRGDLKLLVMSATLDGERVAELLDGAPVIASRGRGHPVEIEYLGRDPGAPLPETVAHAVVRALARGDGDVLAFLPGTREIRRAQALLRSALSGDRIRVLPLYGDLPWKLQEQAISPNVDADRRRVVLATPIAETSLTIEGVRIVVDSGFARLPQFDPRSGLSRLTTVRISRASADQRAGRAGRLAPGVCYRLWSERAHRGLIPQAIPEIKIADLAPLALELALWGTKEAATLSWLDAPPEGALSQARQLLGELGALDDRGAVTAIGREMARLPLHPRLSRMLLLARSMHAGALACDIAALLSERDVLVGESRRSCDLVARLETLARFRAQACDCDPVACTRVDRAARQLRRLLDVGITERSADADTAGLLLASAYPDRVAKQRAPNDVRYRLASGRGARLPEHEQRLRKPFLVAASLDAGEGEGAIHLAATVTLDAVRAHLCGHVRRRQVVRWDAQQRAVVALDEERLGELVLSARPLPRSAAREDIRAALIDGIRRSGPEVLPWTHEARGLQARVSSMRHWFPEEGWPDLSDTALMTNLEGWLGPYLDGLTRFEDLAAIDLRAALEAMLGWERRQSLDEGAPTHIRVPSGSRVRLQYSPGESPVLAVKLQEMFGLGETPRVARGAVPVTLHLLSPARRPIQVTQDLRGFWERTYAEVKKALKARYPKHPWPDDPWRAAPTARTKKTRLG